jgi:large subunit ribosomal protein L10
MMRQRPVPQKKLDEVEHLKKLVETHSVIGLAHLEKMPANNLQDLRQNLRKDVIIHVSKKRLIKRAFEQMDKPNLMEFSKKLTGITALLFTNMDPVKLAKYLESKATKGNAKPGDIAPFDIVVHDGDTKLAPGPIVSDFAQFLKLQTQVKNGTIHIKNEVVTHKAGQVIGAKEAELLTRLGITPIDIKLDLYGAWNNGNIISSEVLHVNDAKIQADVQKAALQALNIAMELGLITKETAVPLLLKAARIARGVALKSNIIIPELVNDYVQKASREANAIKKVVPNLEDSKTE